MRLICWIRHKIHIWLKVWRLVSLIIFQGDGVLLTLLITHLSLLFPTPGAVTLTSVATYSWWFAAQKLLKNSPKHQMDILFCTTQNTKNSAVESTKQSITTSYSQLAATKPSDCAMSSTDARTRHKNSYCSCCLVWNQSKDSLKTCKWPQTSPNCKHAQLAAKQMAEMIATVSLLKVKEHLKPHKCILFVSNGTEWITKLDVSHMNFAWVAS